MGKNAAMKMMNDADASPIPSHNIASGIHAIGGMGRNNSKMGFIYLLRKGESPIVNPRADPRINAQTNPITVRFRLAKICGNITPLATSEYSADSTCVGAGKKGLWMNSAMSHHNKKNPASETLHVAVF